MSMVKFLILLVIIAWSYCVKGHQPGSHGSSPHFGNPPRGSFPTFGLSKQKSYGFDEIYRWKQLTFTPLQTDPIIFGLTDQRVNDLTASDIKENYISSNNLPMGATHHKGRIFITIPRRRPGVPATISFVRSEGHRGSCPSLQAYPNFRTNEQHKQNQPDRKRIASVYRSRVDACNRLWFVDTGALEYPDNTIQVQPPSIWIFDLNSDFLVRRFEIPTNNIVAGHGIASLEIDVDDDKCEDAFAYLPDLVNYRLHVYSFRANQLWSFTHNYLGYDPLRGDFDVAGVQFQWNDGIFSITLTERHPNGFKDAYFHAMASISEFKVSTQVLKNQTLSTRSNHGRDFQYVGDRSDLGQSAMHVYDKRTGLMFFSQVSLNGIGCWDSSLPLIPKNFHLIAQDNTTMIYPSDINIDSDGVIWVMTNKLPLFPYASIDPSEYNYRIWKAPVEAAIKGTPCGQRFMEKP